jgi:hypothetical protein
MFINYKKSLIAATGEGVKNQARMSGFALCKGTVDKQVLQKDDRPGGGTLAGLGGTRGRNEEGVFYLQRAACHNSPLMVQD